MMTMMAIAMITTFAKLCLIGHTTNANTIEVLERAEAMLQSISKSLKPGKIIGFIFRVLSI